MQQKVLQVCIIIIMECCVCLPSAGSGCGSPRGRRGLLWRRGVTRMQWRRGTREGGGQWALLSATDSPPSSSSSKWVRRGCLLRTPTHSTAVVTRRDSTPSPYTCTHTTHYVEYSRKLSAISRFAKASFVRRTQFKYKMSAFVIVGI